jgi:hypothetical protein
MYVIGLIMAGVLVSLDRAAAEDPIDTPTEQQNMQAYMDLLLEDLESQKVSIISQMMEFTPEQAAAFWPMYKEYSKELDQIATKRLANIADYADNFGELSDDRANELVDRAYDIQTQRLAARRRFHEQLKGAFPGLLAGKFFQVESQMVLLIDLQVAAKLPIVD